MTIQAKKMSKNELKLYRVAYDDDNFSPEDALIHRLLCHIAWLEQPVSDRGRRKE
jgi:hypothetical protein